MRADADTAAGLLADTFQVLLHTPYFPHGEHPVRRNLEFAPPLVFLDQLDGYREQLDNIGCLGLHTVSNQLGVAVRIRVDIPVRKFLQVGRGQPAHGKNPVVIVLDEIHVQRHQGDIHLTCPSDNRTGTCLVHQPPVGALGFRLADLPFVIPDLDIEDLHQRMDLLAKAVIAVIDLLGCQERIVVREILIVLADLRLDVLQLPVQPSCLLGFAFGIPKGKGNIRLQLKLAVVPLTVIRPMTGTRPFFMAWFLV